MYNVVVLLAWSCVVLHQGERRARVDFPSSLPLLFPRFATARPASSITDGSLATVADGTPATFAGLDGEASCDAMSSEGLKLSPTSFSRSASNLPCACLSKSSCSVVVNLRAVVARHLLSRSVLLRAVWVWLVGARVELLVGVVLRLQLLVVNLRADRVGAALSLVGAFVELLVVNLRASRVACDMLRRL